MGNQIRLVGLCLWMCLISFSFYGVNAQNVSRQANEKGIVLIHVKAPIAKIDDDFICATLDWWPPSKCDYGTCSWGNASLLNLDLNNKILLNAVKAFSPLKIRLGGTLQDHVMYGTEDYHKPCNPITKNTSDMFGFTEGCLPMKRWDELNRFFQKARAKIIFGLNALTGRSIHPGHSTGFWDYSNAESFIRYTVRKNYTIHGWELGNELCGGGVITSVTADQYSFDIRNLRNVVQTEYRGIKEKPLVIAPGGFFDENWFTEFLNKSGEVMNAVTHHIYNLGPGVDKHLVEKILDPFKLNDVVSTFSGLETTLKKVGTKAKAWVGEAGGAYNSGHHLVSDAFIYSFWYLDQLGMSASYDTKTYCRQSLVGGNYGLLNTTTFKPNPDYYSALLWHRLMGERVLSTSFYGSNKIRAYTHCAKKSKGGITVLLINLSNNTVEVEVASRISKGLWQSKVFKSSEGRREYHLTAKDHDLQSQVMLLNGKALTVNSAGHIPPLKPVYVDSLKPIVVGPHSIVFAEINGVHLPACS